MMMTRVFLNRLVKVALSHVLVLTVYTCVFIGLLRTEILSSIPLFYRGCLFLTVTVVIVCALAAVWHCICKRDQRGPWLTLESLTAAVIVSGSLNLAFFVLVPVTIDRSVTTFLLASIEAASDNKTALSKEDLERILEVQYLGEFDAVGRRLEEQRLSGNVRMTAGNVYLITDQGKDFLAIARRIAAVYGVAPRYVTTERPAQGTD